jgi:hypothetical protein
MKKVFSILMATLILLITFQRGLIVIHFKLNQDYIEKNYCVNKTKPKLQCHGQCQLKKELQKTSDTNLENLSIYKHIELIPLKINIFKIEKIEFREKLKISFYREDLFIQNFVKRILHPPTFLF